MNRTQEIEAVDRSDLVDKEYRISVCVACGRYGQISRANGACAVAAPHPLFNTVEKDHFRRIKSCQAIAAKREDRGW